MTTLRRTEGRKGEIVRVNEVGHKIFNAMIGASTAFPEGLKDGAQSLTATTAGKKVNAVVTTYIASERLILLTANKNGTRE